MAYVANKRKILKILVENLRNAHPQVVESERIAEELDMTPKEICQIIKMMNKMGEVETDQDGQRLLITPQGLAWMHSTGHAVMSAS